MTFGLNTRPAALRFEVNGERAASLDVAVDLAATQLRRRAIYGETRVIFRDGEALVWAMYRGQNRVVLMMVPRWQDVD